MKEYYFKVVYYGTVTGEDERDAKLLLEELPACEPKRINAEYIEIQRFNETTISKNGK